MTFAHVETEMRRDAVGEGASEDGAVEGVTGGAVAFAERLAVAVVVIDGERRSGVRGEDGSDSPATQQVAHHTLLRTEKRRVIYHREGVNELIVEELRTVHGVQVPGIEHGVFAGGLHLIASTQGAAPGEVGPQGDAVPIVGGEREIGSVVIAVACAGIGVHRRNLSGSSIEGRTGHGAAEGPAPREAVQSNRTPKDRRPGCFGSGPAWSGSGPPPRCNCRSLCRTRNWRRRAHSQRTAVTIGRGAVAFTAQ